MAYVTFELERLLAAPGEKREELSALHDVVRGIVRELRETIYQLRANVSEEQDLVTVAADYLVRWAERTGIRGHLTAEEAGEHARRAGAKSVLLTHVSDELDAEQVAAEGSHGFGAPVTVASEGATLDV